MTRRSMMARTRVAKALRKKRRRGAHPQLACALCSTHAGGVGRFIGRDALFVPGRLQKATARRTGQKREAAAAHAQLALASEHGEHPPFDAAEHRGACFLFRPHVHPPRDLARSGNRRRDRRSGVIACENHQEFCCCSSAICRRPAMSKAKTETPMCSQCPGKPAIGVVGDQPLCVECYTKLQNAHAKPRRTQHCTRCVMPWL